MAGTRLLSRQADLSQLTPHRRTMHGLTESLLADPHKVLEAFIQHYGNTFFGALARARLEELKKQQVAVAAPPKAPMPPPASRPTPVIAQPPARCDGVLAAVGSERRCLKPKDTFRDCPECPEMVVVPAGSFMMGSDESSAEMPVHRVTIAKAFAVGKFEVTFAEWDACVAAGGCKHKPEDAGWGRGKRPVINVSWDDITKEYLPWLSREDRLAGGVFHRGPNPLGLARLRRHRRHEWVQDCWYIDYQGAPTDGSARPSESYCLSRILRGGSWYGIRSNLRSAFRVGDTPGLRSIDVGFRVASTLSPL
jgi:formylglycine-generating enzyme required for sulfatase activity